MPDYAGLHISENVYAAWYLYSSLYIIQKRRSCCFLHFLFVSPSLILSNTHLICSESPFLKLLFKTSFQVIVTAYQCQISVFGLYPLKFLHLPCKGSSFNCNLCVYGRVRKFWSICVSAFSDRRASVKDVYEKKRNRARSSYLRRCAALCLGDPIFLLKRGSGALRPGTTWNIFYTLERCRLRKRYQIQLTIRKERCTQIHVQSYKSPRRIVRFLSIASMIWIG